MLRWIGDVQEIPLEAFGLRYRCYRLACPEAEASMGRSLERYGQLSPVVACLEDGTPHLIDGFKRFSAARRVPALPRLRARVFTSDERTAKAAILGLNRVAGRTRDLEEAWIVHALVREDGLTQKDVAALLGCHKTWVCRCLALVERLGAEAKEKIRLGLLSVSVARELVRLPPGNQLRLLETMRREELSRPETKAVVDLLLGATTKAQRDFVLTRPREAIAQARGNGVAPADPRLSPEGRRASKRLSWLLEGLGRLETWLREGSAAALTPLDRTILDPVFARLARDGRAVAELADDLLALTAVP